MNFEPLRNKLIVKRDAPETEISGFLIPEEAKIRPQRGEILAIGSEVKDVKVGDRVMFGKNDGSIQKIEGIEVLLMSEQQIWAVIE